MKVYDESEVHEKLNDLKDWSYSDKSIEKTFEVNDFASALAFTLKAGIEAEKADHHPDILIHSWNKVKITLSTHSEGGVTDKDFDLALKIEKI
ncbi:MAG: 4a-hydroxytetrahydrobiopterin dehydratase [Ignavibacteriae bacterium]|nr:4a-hydroxytetrahydrobiopterin dehydratase [Ignavibacteriota bacterium]NOG96513.1 4a-hydroxytetrahydrobiopterin dehydratase [Ignavibacteriota bacterium]